MRCIRIYIYHGKGVLFLSNMCEQHILIYLCYVKITKFCETQVYFDYQDKSSFLTHITKGKTYGIERWKHKEWWDGKKELFKICMQIHVTNFDCNNYVEINKHKSNSTELELYVFCIRACVNVPWMGALIDSRKS